MPADFLETVDFSSQSGKILVIRGGAIGDFILTLPAIKLLRQGFPSCQIEIIGYRHICALAEKRYYADAIRSIEYSAMAGFFNPQSELNPELAAYFSSFHQVVSYLFDPDHFFSNNLARCGVKQLLTISPHITDCGHAARQLARPLESLALFLDSPAAEFFPSAEDRANAENSMHGWQHPIIAIHPGSGSEKKNWPLPKFHELLNKFVHNEDIGTVALIGGESDATRISELHHAHARNEKIRILKNLPLCTLGAILSRCDLFIGHDSGISHLAAAAGTKCLLMFGPTNPSIWAPQNPNVEILASSSGSLENLSVRELQDRIHF